jgi:predicted ABC-type ATPase
MRSAAELWIIAGPNGAGKTTLARSLLSSQEIEVLNPDIVTLGKIKSAGYDGFGDAPLALQKRLFIASANEVSASLEKRLASGQCIGVETVLSTDKYKATVEKVLSMGGFVRLIYVALQSPQLSAERVAQRVLQGGHDVPRNKLTERWEKSIRNLGWFAKKSESFFVYDNSDSIAGNRVPLIASGLRGLLTVHEEKAIPLLTSSLRAAFKT